MAKFWLSKSIKYVKHDPNLSNFFLIETSIFKSHHFLKWPPIFDDFYLTERKTKKLFKVLNVGFGPKGMTGRMCNIVHLKWGLTNTRMSHSSYQEVRKKLRKEICFRCWYRKKYALDNAKYLGSDLLKLLLAYIFSLLLSVINSFDFWCQILV